MRRVYNVGADIVPSPEAKIYTQSDVVRILTEERTAACEMAQRSCSDGLKTGLVIGALFGFGVAAIASSAFSGKNK